MPSNETSGHDHRCGAPDSAPPRISPGWRGARGALTRQRRSDSREQPCHDERSRTIAWHSSDSLAWVFRLGIESGDTGIVVTSPHMNVVAAFVHDQCSFVVACVTICLAYKCALTNSCMISVHSWSHAWPHSWTAPHRPWFNTKVQRGKRARPSGHPCGPAPPTYSPSPPSRAYTAAMPSLRQACTRSRCCSIIFAARSLS